MERERKRDLEEEFEELLGSPTKAIASREIRKWRRHFEKTKNTFPRLPYKRRCRASWRKEKKRNEGWTSLDPSGRVEIFTNGGSGTDLDPSPPITMSTDETDESWNDASMWRSEKWVTVWKERRKMAVDFYYYYYYFSTPCQPWITC